MYQGVGKCFRIHLRAADPSLIFQVLAGASNLYADISGWLEPCREALNGDRETLKRTFRSNGNALKGDEPGPKGG